MNPNLSNYGWGLPIAASSYAHRIDWALNFIHLVMIVIFVLWGLYMAYCLIRYRHKAGITADREHLSLLTSYIPDGLILVFDIWLIFIIGIPLWAHIREELPKPENALVVNVVAEQFAWNIHYPGPDNKFGMRDPTLISAANPLGLDETDSNSKDDITTINELTIPVGKPVLVNLSSKDVIHSFFVPEFRTKLDVVPGMKNSMWFQAIITGKFEIGCAQLCGLGHYRMRGDVIVKTAEDFDAWLKQKQKEK